VKIEKIRADFPVLKKGIIYFDNACMTLRPKQVIEAMNEYYYEFPACPGRSLHQLGNKASEAIAIARKKIARFIGAKNEKEIVFTRNTTEAINLIAHSLKFGKKNTVLSSDREHNSNLVPWIIARERGIKHVIVKEKESHEFDLDAFSEAMNESVKLVSIVHASNLDGYILPVKEIIKTAHDFNALVLLDGAQSAPHSPLNVKKMDCDFFAFSSHKALGPSGIGALYGKKHLLEELRPFISGGSTVSNSTYESAEFLEVPEKLEGGLQDVAGIIGFGKACDYIEKIGRSRIAKHERKLNKKFQSGLLELEKAEIIGVKDTEKKTGITSFNIGKLDSHEVALLLDEAKIAMRSGMHCLHSWFNAHKLRGAVRASFYAYNTEWEVEKALLELSEIEKHLA